MDLPTTRGVYFESPFTQTSRQVLHRSNAVEKLISWGSDHGVLSRDAIKFTINERGRIRCVANHFIPANKHILHIPFALDLSFNSMKLEIHPQKNWIGWNDLKNRLKAFEESFVWNPNNFEQKDYFSKNIFLTVCIIGLLHKMKSETIQSTRNHRHHNNSGGFPVNDYSRACISSTVMKGEYCRPCCYSTVSSYYFLSPQRSLLFQSFIYYWKALPQDIGNVLYNWSQLELMCLQGSSFGNCLPDARRLGEEMYSKVLLPFLQTYPQQFGVINNNKQTSHNGNGKDNGGHERNGKTAAPSSSSSSFASSGSAGSLSLPSSSFTLEDYFKINSMILTRSFGTGKKGNKSSLLPIVDWINGKPNDLHNVTLENCAIQKEINGEFIKFHAIETCCDIHAGEELFLEYAQVGNGDYLMTYNHLPLDPEVIMNNQKTEIFLDLSKFFEIELLRMHPNNASIRSMKMDHIFGFFNLPKCISISMNDLFSAQYSCIPSIRQVLIFLQFDETEAKNSIQTSRIKSQLSPNQLQSLFHLFLKFIECSLNKPDLELFHSLLGNQLPGSIVKALENTLKAAFLALPVTEQQKQQQLSYLTSQAALPLTENMKSAIYLQMSERLVIEVMINRFINLFPEGIHEFGYSIMSDHLISSEVNALLEELMKPYEGMKVSQCFICGNKKNLSKCSRCRKAYYCSSHCQKEHWPYHRNSCKQSSV